MRLVLDTNVILDLLHFADPSTRALGLATSTGKASCYTDAVCLGELQRVLAYPVFALDAQRQSALLAAYRELATACEGTDASDDYDALPRCRDLDDQKFIVLAARCRADLLITRDARLLELRGFRLGARRCRIVTAQDAAALF